MNWIVRAIWMGTLLLSGPAFSASLSGTYLGKGPGSVFMIQLVEGADRSLTGRYVQTTLLNTGAIQQTNASVAGTHDGSAIVLSIKPAELLSGTMTVSGTVDDVTLKLSGGGYGRTLNLQLVKGDNSQFENAIATLNLQARQIITAKAQEDLLKRIRDFKDKVNHYSTRVEQTRARLVASPYERRYRQVTEWMGAAHNRQTAIYGGGQASVARGQIGIAINQAAIQAEQFHRETASAWQSVQAEHDLLAKSGGGISDICANANGQTASDLSADIQDTCSKLAEAILAIKPQADALKAIIVAGEKTWQEERKKQEQIIRAADYAVR